MDVKFQKVAQKYRNDETILFARLDMGNPPKPFDLKVFINQVFFLYKKCLKH